MAKLDRGAGRYQLKSVMNYQQNIKCLFLLTLFLRSFAHCLFSQTSSPNESLYLAKRLGLEETEQEGNWAVQNVKLSNTSEAQFVWRFGDIDNFNQTWRVAHNPFSGEIASPLTIENALLFENRGVTDRAFNLPDKKNSPQRLHAIFDLSPIPKRITDYSIQFYIITNGQKTEENAWIASINGVEQLGLQQLLKKMEMKPYQGYLINWYFPATLFTPPDEELEITLGLQSTNSKSVFAVDFFKILGNPHNPQFKVNINGVVRSINSGNALSDIKVQCQGRKTYTDSKGHFSFNQCAAGVSLVSIGEKKTESQSLNLAQNEKKKLYFLK